MLLTNSSAWNIKRLLFLYCPLSNRLRGRRKALVVLEVVPEDVVLDARGQVGERRELEHRVVADLIALARQNRCEGIEIGVHDPLGMRLALVAEVASDELLG